MASLKCHMLRMVVFTEGFPAELALFVLRCDFPALGALFHQDELPLLYRVLSHGTV